MEVWACWPHGVPAVICAKGSLDLVDAVVLIVIYVAYLMVLSRMPPQEAEGSRSWRSFPAPS